MQKYLLMILFSYLSVHAIEYWLKFINLRYMKKHRMDIPTVFKGHIDESILGKIHAYTIENSHFSFLKSLFGNAVLLIFLFGGLLKIYNSWISSLNLSFIFSGITFFLLLSYAGTFLSIPFSLYNTFKIENKYGFNTTTLRLWITDFLKSLMLSTILIGIVVSVALWLIQSSLNYWWIWVWGFYLIFSLFIMYVSPYVIEPLFNKFTPIDEERLVEKIREIMQKAGIKVSRVFKIDASKRSHHTNAYFTGLGNVKRIILYDTLLAKMDHDEVLAVLSHEAGHWRKKHVLKLIIISEIASLIAIYISFRILQTDFLTNIFRIEPQTFFAKIIILGFIGSIVSFPFIPLGNYISRRFEREADRFSYELTKNKESISRALIKLSKDNLSDLYPHPLYAAFYYSHPPVVQRIESILKTESIS
jgi:STE24 endopeptidase